MRDPAAGGSPAADEASGNGTAAGSVQAALLAELAQPARTTS